MAETSKPNRNRAERGAGQPPHDVPDVGQAARRGSTARSSAPNTAILRQALAWPCRPSRSLWGRKRVVGSKLKHDGTLGYISRGAARRSGLNPAGWHRYVPIVAAVAVIVIALAALGYAGGGANLDAMFKSPELAHARYRSLSRALRPRRASRPSAVSLRRPPPSPMRKRTKASKKQRGRHSRVIAGRFRLQIKWHRPDGT